MIVILSPTAQLASDTLTLDTPPSLTIEAEYGSWVCQGSVYTAAHHQPLGSEFSGRHIGGARPAPCNDPNIPVMGNNDVVLISHIDADTLGGLMRATGKYETLFDYKLDGFWDYVEFVDTHGWHKADPQSSHFAPLSAIGAYLQKNRPNTPRDSNSDVTDFVVEAMGFVSRLLEGGLQELQVGVEFIKTQDDLNLSSWVTTTPFNVVVRRSNSFTNHLYRDPNGMVGLGIVAYNDSLGSITISLADPIKGVSCREVVQSLWGTLAGGHDGIAGSPRGQIMSEADFKNAVKAFSQALAYLG
jgi:hypothetical protein